MTLDLAARLALVAKSALSIYDPIAPTDSRFFADEELEHLLRARLRGVSLAFPLRTRAKVAKSLVCEALGYPTPASFRKTQPRFPGQQLDIYVQKSLNLQIWNEEIDVNRRYALIRLDEHDTVIAVRVMRGGFLARLDTTGTLTRKYQARRRDDTLADRPKCVLVSSIDTEQLRAELRPKDMIDRSTLARQSPSTAPVRDGVYSISALMRSLERIVGRVVPDPGVVQDRNRGASLHREVCRELGFGEYRDNGQFPDILSQLLEVKLQTSPTIDLGLVSPDSTAVLTGLPIRHCDVRYAVFYGRRVENGVLIAGLVVSTGRDFFSEFERFGGLVTNAKLQIPLPSSLFDSMK